MKLFSLTCSFLSGLAYSNRKLNMVMLWLHLAATISYALPFMVDNKDFDTLLTSAFGQYEVHFTVVAIIINLMMFVGCVHHHDTTHCQHKNGDKLA